MTTLFFRLSFGLVTAFALACVLPAMPTEEPLRVEPVQPARGQSLKVDHVALVMDTSSSVKDDFPAQKALVRSFVEGMPEGDYGVTWEAFGGSGRQSASLDSFSRDTLRSGAAEMPYLGRTTPLGDVLGDVRSAMQGKTGNLALVIFSDGRPTASGRPVPSRTATDPVRGLIREYEGTVCVHTVQTGESELGADVLRELAGLSECGSFRRASELQTLASLEGFESDVFVQGQALPPVAAAPPRRPLDSDGDGVLDGSDECPRTPVGAGVDGRGCWTLENLRFAFDSTEIDPRYEDELREVAGVLLRNSKIRVRVDGHTDSVGAEAYNRALSERRALSVHDYLVSQGVPDERIEMQGWGESRPAAPNDTREGRATNRRIELTVVE